MKKKTSCPNCDEETDLSKSNQFRPFCSERCRLIDLGQWFEENYNIKEPLNNIDGDFEDKNIH